MAVYNGANFLRKQLDSIYSQTYKDIEVIAIDDCSTDNSPKILKEYHEEFGLIYQNNPKNLGYLKTFEIALSLCSGDFIAFSDQDDIWLPEKIERLINEIGEHSLIYSDASIINEDDHIIIESISKYTKTGALPSSEHHFKKATFYWLALGCTMLFKQELLKDFIPFLNDGTAHDRQVSIHAGRRNKIKNLKTPLVHYRLHSRNTFGVVKGSIMREFSPRYLYPWGSEVKRIKGYLKQKLYANENDHQFLNEILGYYESKCKKGIHFRAMKVALKYRNIFFNDFTFVEKMLLILGNILFFDKGYLYFHKNKK